MYEHKKQPLLNKKHYFRRMLKHSTISMALILGALAVGVIGYCLFEKMSFIDALLNSSMLLGGMGPVGELKTNAGKLFASFYALFSGLIFLAAFSIVLAPVFHRFLHKFHIEDK